MLNKQEQRAEETKQAILTAAGKLFAEHGFDAVTMRQIAKQAGCSHTTIYIYFKDKEALLHELSMPPLLSLKEHFEQINQQIDGSATSRLHKLCHEFIRFCLHNRNMYTVIFSTKAGRVDEKQPALEINALRNELFSQLMHALQQCLGMEQDDERLLDFSRILFYALHGIVGTYTHSEESVEALYNRLHHTFDKTIDVILLGLREAMKNVEETGEA